MQKKIQLLDEAFPKINGTMRVISDEAYFYLRKNTNRRIRLNTLDLYEEEKVQKIIDILVNNSCSRKCH